MIMKVIMTIEMVMIIENVTDARCNRDIFAFRMKFKTERSTNRKGEIYLQRKWGEAKTREWKGEKEKEKQEKSARQDKGEMGIKE